MSELESELKREKEVSESLDELYVEKERQLEQEELRLEQAIEELKHEKEISESLLRLYEEKERPLEQEELTLEQAIEECAYWKKESASWQKISNEMKSECAKFKDQCDQLQTQVVDLGKQLQLKVQDVAEKKAEFDKLDEIAKECVAQWYWTGDHDDDHAFDMAANPLIEQAYQSNVGCGTMRIQSGTYMYEVNFDTMTQTNVKSGRQRGIRRRLFGTHSADLVGVIKLALMARSQEAEMVKLQCATAAKAHQEEVAQIRSGAEEAAKAQAAKAHQEEVAQIRSGAEEDMLACQTTKRMVEKELEESQRRLREHESTIAKTREEVETLTASKQEVVQELNALRQAQGVSGSLADAKARSVAELWKAPVAPGVFEKMQESSSTVDKVTSLFKEVSHKNPFFQGAVSRCSAFQRLKIHNVSSLHNPRLWRKYQARKEELKCMHSERAVNLPALDPCVHGLTSLIDGLHLDISMNEVLLGHGCSEEAASAIVKDGFDIRFTGAKGGSMYGQGLYFSHELCKVNQYTDTQGPSHLRHLIIARVTLGDHCFLTGPRQQERLPPLRNGEKSRHDSSVVNPQYSQSGQQAHWECVIFDGTQAYPELLITYETP